MFLLYRCIDLLQQQISNVYLCCLWVVIIRYKLEGNVQVFDNFDQLKASFQKELLLYHNLDRRLEKYNQPGQDSDIDSTLTNEFRLVREILSRQVVFFSKHHALVR